MSEKPASYQIIFVKRFNFLSCCVFVCMCSSFPQKKEGNKKKAMAEKIKRIKNLTDNKEKRCLGKEWPKCIFLAQKSSATSVRIWRGE